MLACCAFAVFLLSQLLAPFAWVRDRLWGAPRAGPNTAVTWSPGDAAAPARRPFRLRAGPRRAIVLILLLETVAVGGSVAAATLVARADAGSVERRLERALHDAVCRATGRTPS